MLSLRKISDSGTKKPAPLEGYERTRATLSDDESEFLTFPVARSTASSSFSLRAANASALPGTAPLTIASPSPATSSQNTSPSSPVAGLRVWMTKA